MLRKISIGMSMILSAQAFVPALSLAADRASAPSPEAIMAAVDDLLAEKDQNARTRAEIARMKRDLEDRDYGIVRKATFTVVLPAAMVATFRQALKMSRATDARPGVVRNNLILLGAETVAEGVLLTLNYQNNKARSAIRSAIRELEAKLSENEREISEKEAELNAYRK